MLGRQAAGREGPWGGPLGQLRTRTGLRRRVTSCSA